MIAKIFPIQAKYGFCNERGEIIVSPRFDDVRINDYFNAFKVGFKWGFLDNEGKCILEAQFDDVDFYDDKAIVIKDDKKGLYSSELKVILESKYKRILLIDGFIIYEDDIGLHIKKESISYEIYVNSLSTDSDEVFFKGGRIKSGILRNPMINIHSLNSNKKYIGALIKNECPKDFLAVFSNEEKECYIKEIEATIRYEIELIDIENKITMLVEVAGADLSKEYKFYYLEGDISSETTFKRAFEGIKVKSYENSGKYILLVDENYIFYLFDKPNNLIFKGKKSKMKKETKKRKCYFLIRWFNC